jgi:hypothetical protein
MRLEELERLSPAFGEALHRVLEARNKEAIVEGGGLRHGDLEWKVRYQAGLLRRYLFFTLHADSTPRLVVSIRAAATDGSGNWAYVPVGSSVVPEDLGSDENLPTFASWVDNALAIANSIGDDELHPPAITTPREG